MLANTDLVETIIASGLGRSLDDVAELGKEFRRQGDKSFLENQALALFVAALTDLPVAEAIRAMEIIGPLPLQGTSTKVGEDPAWWVNHGPQITGVRGMWRALLRLIGIGKKADTIQPTLGERLNARIRELNQNTTGVVPNLYIGFVGSEVRVAALISDGTIEGQAYHHEDWFYAQRLPDMAEVKFCYSGTGIIVALADCFVESEGHLSGAIH